MIYLNLLRVLPILGRLSLSLAVCLYFLFLLGVLVFCLVARFQVMVRCFSPTRLVPLRGTWDRPCSERVAFSRSLWGLGACFRASGILARCVFEHAAVSAFQAFLAKLPAKGPLRSIYIVLSRINWPLLLEAVSAFRFVHALSLSFSLAHFVRSLPVSVSLWSGISPGLRSCSLGGKKNVSSCGSLIGRRGHWPQSLAAPVNLSGCPPLVLLLSPEPRSRSQCPPLASCVRKPCVRLLFPNQFMKETAGHDRCGHFPSRLVRRLVQASSPLRTALSPLSLSPPAPPASVYVTRRVAITAIVVQR